MNNKLLKKNISFYEDNKVLIVKYWITNEEVLKILKKYNIKINYFVQEYAYAIIEYYMEIIKDNNKIGSCSIVKDLLQFLKKSNVLSSDLFILCSGLKNSLIEHTYNFKINSLDLEKEINYIFEKSFSSVLEKYTTLVNDVEKKLTEYSDITNEYVIMSRTDENGNIINVSDALCKVTGFSRDELIGKPFLTLVSSENIDISNEEIDEILNSKKNWKTELKSSKKNGDFYWSEITVIPFFKDKKLQYVDTIRQDISSKKELEEQQSLLIEQSKLAAMGEMISMIAHQWRQPLQAVSILTQKLPITKMIDGEISEELLDQVVDGVAIQLDYMSKTIDDFRDFFLPDKSKELVSVRFILDKALDFVSFLIKTDLIEVDIKGKTEKNISVYVNDLMQVIINIVKNARDILVEKNIESKKINISYYELNEFICIEIEDNAGGIPEKIINKVFDPYFSTKDEKNGTGLGLYMCKTIIEKHCLGVLSVKNSKKGAVFTIKLPIS